MGKSIKLGEHDYDVLPQRIGYLTHKLGPKLKEVLELDVEGMEGADAVTAKVHGVLNTFIPDLMPLHEFLGYHDKAAMDAGEYDEKLDKSPEPLQVKDAFNAAKTVNGGEVLDHLKALLGPVLSQRVVAALTAMIADRMSSISEMPGSSPTSPPTSGVSAQTSSGTTAPTPLRPVNAD